MRRVLHPWRDWVNTRWFDVTRGVTTCGDEPAAGNGHQPAWTCEVRFWFDRLSVEPGFLERTFIDVGCGKGKVLLAWRERLEFLGIQQSMLGLEYDTALVQQASKNLQRMGWDMPVHAADAAVWPYRSVRRPLLLWLFNPFGDEQVRQLAAGLDGTDTLMVYHNPKHADVFLDAGWWPLAIKPGVHEKNTSMLLSSGRPA